jgi:hypothetical protein
MQAAFLEEALKYSVLPLDDRVLERTNAALVGRPSLMEGRTSLTLYPGMIGISENIFINLKNKSHVISADVEIPKSGASGVLLAQAGRFGGWSLYVKDGKPTYTYNWLGLQRYTVAAAQPLAPGKATIRFEFAYDGGGPGKGGKATILATASRSRAGRSSVRSAASSRPTRAPTSGRTTGRRSPKRTSLPSSSRAPSAASL